MIEKVNDPKYIEALARSLFTGYVKDTKNEIPGGWATLDKGGRSIWTSMAKRAVRKIVALNGSKKSTEGQLSP
jgi:hypothetical protein